MAFIINNLTGSRIDNNAGNVSTHNNITRDSIKELQNHNSNTDIDLLANRLNKLELSEKEINLHMDKHHTEFIYGVICSTAGVGLTVGGIMLISKGRYSRNNYNTNTNNTNMHHHSTSYSGTGDIVSGIGLAMSIVGFGIMIDSDKWFSKKHNHNW
jgi:hypothetical protein